MEPFGNAKGNGMESIAGLVPGINPNEAPLKGALNIFAPGMTVHFKITPQDILALQGD